MRFSQDYPNVKYVNWTDVLFEPLNTTDGSCFCFLDRDHYSACVEAVIADKFSFDLEAWFSDESD